MSRAAARTKPGKASKARVASRSASRARPAPDAIVLGADCTLREAAALKAQLLSGTTSTQTVCIDGGAVERIDTAGLQLLVAFARRERDAGRTLQWRAASPELRNAGAWLGLLDVLALPAAGGD